MAAPKEPVRRAELQQQIALDTLSPDGKHKKEWTKRAAKLTGRAIAVGIIPKKGPYGKIQLDKWETWALNVKQAAVLVKTDVSPEKHRKRYLDTCDLIKGLRKSLSIIEPTTVGPPGPPEGSKGLPPAKSPCPDPPPEYIGPPLAPVPAPPLYPTLPPYPPLPSDSPSPPPIPLTSPPAEPPPRKTSRPRSQDRRRVPCPKAEWPCEGAIMAPVLTVLKATPLAPVRVYWGSTPGQGPCHTLERTDGESSEAEDRGDRDRGSESEGASEGEDTGGTDHEEEQRAKGRIRPHGVADKTGTSK